MLKTNKVCQTVIESLAKLGDNFSEEINVCEGRRIATPKIHHNALFVRRFRRKISILEKH